MPKTKTGEVITWKEAGKRFKQGIDNITPLQKLQNEIRGTLITLLGFIVAFIAVIIKRESIGLLAYGLILIFLGSIITTGLKYLGMKQQLKFFKNIDEDSLQIKDFLNKLEEEDNGD
jgi:hypothetical protein